ncbi:2Fe-2S ferredoxin-type domain-containing protein [Kockiozyma suomiensis]|uniref:2Fe-2S ferredoxin-type domain-containing protein n=1 Tax=Kockiozyma suomiensis TaxID=1337062 RepID=UPI003343B75F
MASKVGISLLRSASASRALYSTARSSRHIYSSSFCNTSKSPLTSQFQSRSFSNSLLRLHGHVHKPAPGEEIHVTFVTREGEQIAVEVAAGDNLLDVAQAYDLDMEGACGGSCACSTCHIIVDPEYYDLIPEPDDDENDMLDLAFGLTETSRLGCQVIMTKELDGIRVALPQMTRNLQARDFEKR